MRHIYIKGIVAMAVAFQAVVASADIPLDYYAPVQGLSGEELKTALFNIVGQSPDISMLSYGSGNMRTWWGFYVTDRNEDNSVVDRYSNDLRYFGNRGASISGMNIEHSFPKSWWGGTENNAYKDLYNLMPCEAKINSTKSNYPMGVVTKTTAAGNNGCTRVGTGEWGGNWWEPADKWKGDFARGYMYMATAYQDYTYSSDMAKKILSTGEYPTLLPKASALYIKWAKADDVTEMEAVRNDRVQTLQGNRNPFVDFPNLMEYIWGDSIGVPFDLRFTKKSARATGVVDEPSERRVAYEANFNGNEGGFSVEVVDAPANGHAVWINTASYGWKGTSYAGSAQACIVDLVSPEIDLTLFISATLSFRHAVNYCDAPVETLAVLVRNARGEEINLTVPQWPSGKNWTFVNSGDISLDDFAGQKINIIFRYRSDSKKSSTWQISNMKVNGLAKTGGVDTLPALDPDDNIHLQEQWYSIDGRAIDPASYRGIAIRRQGNHVSKHLFL